jgi:primosomal replication protein N
MSHDEIRAFEKIVVFKKHLKMAVKLIIEDIHRNFEAYKVVSPQPIPHCKIVLAKNSEEGEKTLPKKSVAFLED